MNMMVHNVNTMLKYKYKQINIETNELIILKTSYEINLLTCDNIIQKTGEFLVPIAASCVPKPLKVSKKFFENAKDIL